VQSRIVKYGMDAELNRMMSSDMSLGEIKGQLYKAYGISITNGDIEVYYEYRRENPLYQRYLEKKG
jgi:hypothetical protein